MITARQQNQIVWNNIPGKMHHNNKLNYIHFLYSFLSCLLIIVMKGNIACYSKINLRCDAGSLIHQRGQGLCVLIIKALEQTRTANTAVLQGKSRKDWQSQKESAHQSLGFLRSRREMMLLKIVWDFCVEGNTTYTLFRTLCQRGRKTAQCR